LGISLRCDPCGDQSIPNQAGDVCIAIPQPQVLTIESPNCSATAGNPTKLVDCPTAAGVRLTLTGEHLLKAKEKLTVDVGTESCTVVDGQATNASLVCELGASNGGADLVVTVRSGSRQDNSTSSLVSFAKPQLTGIEGCGSSAGGPGAGGPGKETSSVSNCSYGGGEIITVHGQNFGKDAPTVLIGATPCKKASDDERHSDSVMECELTPQQPGLTLPVLVIQASGALSSGASNETLVVKFQACAAGSEPDRDGAAKCNACSSGFSDGLQPCQPCDVGTVPGRGEDANRFVATIPLSAAKTCGST
jgi:hypothetical protein